MYQVLARKWRPRNFDELVGQQHIARTLKNAIESDRLAHAYIFAGLRGTGKTSTARILAKSLNCEQGPAATPCDACVACGEIAESRAIDVMEIDAASRTKVEQTRELLEVVSYAPVRDRYKILIIDEVHMLSTASFNALLKTLEEPPPRVVFLLATTELQKVLPTILSRCQVFEFRRVPLKDVAAHLARICEAEEIRISASTLERIARAGEGSVRDSLSQLERVIAFCGREVDDDDALRVLGAVRGAVVVRLLERAGARDAAGMIEVLDELVGEGHDLLHFWGELIAALRDVMLLKTAPDAGELLLRPADEAALLAEAVEQLELEDLVRIFQVLSDLEPGLKSSSHPRFLFESALIRIASLGSVRPIEEVLAGLDSGSGGGGGPRKTRAAGRSAPAKTRSTGKPKAPRRRAATAGATGASASAPQVTASGFHGRLLAAVQARKPMLAAILEGAGEVAVDGSELRIRLGNDGVRAPLERPGARRLIEEVASELAGSRVRLRIEGIEGIEPAAAEAAGGGPVPGASAPGTPDPGQLAREVRDDPAVGKLLRELGARIVDVRPAGPDGGTTG